MIPSASILELFYFQEVKQDNVRCWFEILQWITSENVHLIRILIKWTQWSYKCGTKMARSKTSGLLFII